MNFSSSSYWENRYVDGGNSGFGSYGRLATYKADFLNNFIKKNKIKSCIEFGCGDGNQLSLLKVRKYIGLDISHTIINKCIDKFKVDKTKSFFVYDTFGFCDNSRIFSSDLSISLDVLFHLVERKVFEKYLKNLFLSSNKYVIIYSSNKNDQKEKQGTHVKHRKFTDYVKKNIPGWKLLSKEKNIFSIKTNEVNESFSDFYVYQKK